MASPITEEEEEGDLPCAVHGDCDSLPFPYLYSTTPLFYTLPPPLTPHRLSPMSHDETHTHYLQPYYSPSPSTDPGPSHNEEDGPFDPGNTPPLIFAFIAVGFIVFGLVVAVIYKKCRPRPPPQDPEHQRSSVPSRRPSVQKPRLWDVWIAPNQRGSDEEQTKLNDWDTFVVSRIYVPVSCRRSVC